jgi:hypothetical protein
MIEGERGGDLILASRGNLVYLLHVGGVVFPDANASWLVGPHLDVASSTTGLWERIRDGG